jgi:hypothetical protein
MLAGRALDLATRARHTPSRRRATGGALNCHYSRKAGKIYSIPLHSCEVALFCCGSIAALPALYQRPFEWQNYFTPSRLGYTHAYHRYFVFSVPNFQTEFLTSLRSSPLFFSRVLPASRLYDNSDGPVRQCRQCRDASAEILRNQRDNVGASAWQFRGTIVALSAFHSGVGTSSRRRRLLVPESAVFCAAHLQIQINARISPGKALRPAARRKSRPRA